MGARLSRGGAGPNVRASGAVATAVAVLLGGHALVRAVAGPTALAVTLPALLVLAVLAGGYVAVALRRPRK